MNGPQKMKPSINSYWICLGAVFQGFNQVGG